MISPTPARRACVIGLGLIGGSIAMGLRELGWQVSGSDVSDRAESGALEVGAVDRLGLDPDAEITFVATPVSALPAEVRRALAGTSGVVTDVGGVKAPVAAAVADARFVPGHPMAGSEQEGLEGADADLFRGAVWVLTPGPETADASLAAVGAVVSSLGADVISLAPERHDALVAVVSHVPHLAAATLMGLATERAIDQGPLLRLAAGGFRDMTRIAAGHPGIWPDICVDNQGAIVDVLDDLVARLGRIRDVVAASDRGQLLTVLESAREARRALPRREGREADLSVVRVPIPDRKGELASITMLCTDLDVDIADIEIAHSAEGETGVLILVVPTTPVLRLVAALEERGYHPSVRSLG